MDYTAIDRSLHSSKQRVVELIPGKKVAWNVVAADLSFVSARHEWKGTQIVFEISKSGGATEVRFTHRGLAASFECYDSCSSGWSLLINGNLRKLITTGEPQPSPWD